MTPKSLYFVDEDEVERRSCGDVLVEIFESNEIKVLKSGPLRAMTDYADIVARSDTGGFILDQRLGTTGQVSYSGIELAEYLRGLDDKIPIVILTNFADDDFGTGGWAVECIVQKKRVLQDPQSAESQQFKARLLRHIDVFEKITNDRARRHHELLVKSLNTQLSAEEQEEMKLLQGVRMAALASAELEKQKALDDDIAKLKRLLGDTIG